jgi:hypothetical protein
MADLAAAAAARERAITGATHNNAAQAWGRWTKYCLSIRCNNFYLVELGRQEQILILRAFGMALHGGRFLLSWHDTLVEGTIRGTISHVVQAFRTKGRPNPTKGIDNLLSLPLSRRFRACRNEDPKEKQQKVLPFSVLDKLALQQVTELDKAIVQLPIGKAFFACRSCEYSKVPRREQKRTKLLCLRNIRFFKDGHLLLASLDNVELADSVAITFEMQKNDMKHETVIHGRTEDANLCPVLQW